jgi:integral membrane protein (TIGR01906 family)
MRGITDRLGGWLISASTAMVILAATVAPFFTPAWVRFEQGRTDVAALTGFRDDQLDAVVSSVLGDLVLWRGDFGVAVDGAQVFDDRERSHLRDVRGVLLGFEIVSLIAIAVLVAAARRRESEARAGTWRAAGRGARGLLVAVAVLGAFVVLAFDAFFEVFHRLFFSAGTYTFDTHTERLVQLFPERFWSETSTLIGLVLAGFAVVIAWIAARRGRAPLAIPRWAGSRARP